MALMTHDHKHPHSSDIGLSHRLVHILASIKDKFLTQNLKTASAKPVKESPEKAFNSLNATKLLREKRMNEARLFQVNRPY